MLHWASGSPKAGIGGYTQRLSQCLLDPVKYCSLDSFPKIYRNTESPRLEETTKII